MWIETSNKDFIFGKDIIWRLYDKEFDEFYPNQLNFGARAFNKLYLEENLYNDTVIQVFIRKPMILLLKDMLSN